LSTDNQLSYFLVDVHNRKLQAWGNYFWLGVKIMGATFRRGPLISS